MKIRGIIWIEEFVEKLAAKHGVQRDEVRQVLGNRLTEFRFIEKGHERGEDVYAASGKTSAGRRLIVFFVRKTEGRALIVSARTMSSAERKRYETK